MGTLIGLAISTHRRPAVLARSLGEWAKHMPDLLVVNHDRDGNGVAATKNAGLRALMDAGCDHLFLADDDIHPRTPDWWLPYVGHPEPHLAMCWGQSRLLQTTDDVTVWDWPRGVLLYAERRVVERVGGMRREFGRWGHEHVEWSLRVHTAGLTTHPYQDLHGSSSLFYALDWHRNHRGTVEGPARREGAAQREAAWEKYAGTDDFVDYR